MEHFFLTKINYNLLMIILSSNEIGVEGSVRLCESISILQNLNNLNLNFQ
jgi:hypothetical protein